MNLAVHCDFDAVWSLPKTHFLVQMLRLGSYTTHTLPFEEVVVKQVSGEIAPVVSLMVLADALDKQWHYLQAIPVHLEARQNSLWLGEAVLLHDDEAQQLLGTLNHHLLAVGDDCLVQGASGTWYWRSATPIDFRTSSLRACLNKPYPDLLGRDAKFLHVRLNEIQMLLHEHPVNVRRERKAMPVVNSLWLNSGGVLPPAPKPVTPAHIWAKDVLHTGLARWLGMPYSPLALDVMDMLGTDAILSLPSLDELERCIQPLTKIWRKYKRIDWLFARADRTLQICLRPQDIYKIWRRRRDMVYFQQAMLRENADACTNENIESCSAYQFAG